MTLSFTPRLKKIKKILSFSPVPFTSLYNRTGAKFEPQESYVTPTTLSLVPRLDIPLIPLTFLKLEVQG